VTRTVQEAQQTVVGAAVVVLALGMGIGASLIPSDAGYAGIGPNFLPWMVSAALLICGLFLVYEARSGGFRDMEDSVGDAPYWPGFVWMSTGLLVNAALITTIGFILSCTLCFVLATRGLRNAQGNVAGGWQTWAKDAAIGLMIAAPVYWMFTKFLAISLPGLTQSGWI
jgi:putative tricarboxylic transport membrane protein